MTHEPHDPAWERLSKALFGVRKTTDEGLFVYRVMEDIRRLSQPLEDLAWSRFMRWALPVLGLSLVFLALAAKTPAPLGSVSLDNALFEQQAPDEDPLSSLLQETR